MTNQPRVAQVAAAQVADRRPCVSGATEGGGMHRMPGWDRSISCCIVRRRPTGQQCTGSGTTLVESVGITVG